MANPIESLQSDVVNKHVSTVDVLQKAILVAHQFGDARFGEWAKRELDGHEEPDGEAEYRYVKGEYAILAGDGRIIPIHLDNSTGMTARFITLPLAELESLLAGDGDQFAVTITVDPKTLTTLDLEAGDYIVFRIARATMSGFISAIRYRVLEWTMNLTSMPHSTAFSMQASDPKRAVAVVKMICERFPLIGRQLQHRHDSRPTLELTDEYDVQDLLHALLRLYFDDIRPEEWTPSHAGKSARMDFLLKGDKIVIEVKKTHDGLDGKRVGDELMIDIAHYRNHPDCKVLICFIYDPENRVANPAGLEADLTHESDEFAVVVVVSPKTSVDKGQTARDGLP